MTKFNEVYSLEFIKYWPLDMYTYKIVMYATNIVKFALK